MGLLETILRSDSTDYTYGSLTDVPGDIPHAAVPANSAYLSITLRSARIVDSRRGWTKFYPVVHSYASIPHRTGELAEFQVVNSPSKLSELDSSHLDRIINLNHRLLGPTPYRGGDLKIEIGLFSVKSSDLAKPFLGVLETMATAAGVSFLSVAKPFVDPLKKGLELLFGSSDLSLEIGLSTSAAKPETGYFFVMRAERGAVKSSDLKVAADFRLVDRSDKAVGKYPYLVFSVEASNSRDDFFMIPDIAEVYSELQEAGRKGKKAEAEEIFTTFKRTALTSPDLLAKHAQKLVQETADELALALPTSMTSFSPHEIPALESMHLFEPENPHHNAGADMQ
jgi:hypothetical protein